MKILLAVDGSPCTQKMLAYLTEHVETWEDSKFTAVTVDPPLPPRARSMVGKDIANSFHEKSAAKVLDPVTRFFDEHDIKLKTAFLVGPPGETIAKYAESGKFDLVMMGSHGKTALGNLVMGSVATKVLANCKVPVLLIR
ncbi:MAG: universal stress protein [Brachymonas sp.]|nr:universal stress protein [Brachymonas sp.]